MSEILARYQSKQQDPRTSKSKINASNDCVFEITPKPTLNSSEMGTELVGEYAENQQYLIQHVSDQPFDTVPGGGSTNFNRGVIKVTGEDELHQINNTNNKKENTNATTNKNKI